MGLAYSLAETLNIAWGVAAGDAKASIQDRLQDLAFRREIAKALSERLDSVAGADARILKSLLSDPDFFAFVANPDSVELRQKIDDGRLEGLLGADQNTERLEALGRSLAMVVEAVVVDRATPQERLLLAKVSRVSDTQIEVVREGFEDVARHLDQIRDDLHSPGRGPVADGVFPQFVGVPDRNAGFVGRVDELTELEEAVGGGGATVITQVAAGLGGVGKTALAAEFCHRQRQRTNVVRWLPAEIREALLTAYVGMGPALGMNLTGLGIEDAVARVRGWFETTERSWLLVFDNAESPNVLDGLVPQTGRGRVLVTSRYRDWTRADANLLRVEVLDTDDAVTLLASLTDRTDAGAVELVGWLDGLALAIEQAAAFCRQTGWTFDHYRQHLERRSREILARNPAALRRSPGSDGQDMVVLTVWEHSLERAAAEADGASAILGVLAYLGADHIPAALLTEPNAVNEPLLRGGDPLYVDEALAVLARYSLIELHHDPKLGEIRSVSVHRLLQEVARLSHDDDTARQACGTAVRLLRRSWPPDSNDPDTWATCRLLESHVTGVVPHVDRHGAELEAASWLLDRYAMYLRHGSNPAAAPAHFERAVRLRTQVAPPNDEILVGLQANLADSYRSAGRVADAIALQERVVADCERIYGKDHRDTLATRGNLATSYLSAGRVADAVALQERVVADCERVLGTDHPNTLATRCNLANSYLSAGRLPEGISILKRVAADRERILGKDHPDMVVTRATLAIAYLCAGPLQEAINLLERVVPDSEHVFGKDHPNTLAARGSLARAYRSTGRTGEAITLDEQVLADSERILGKDHPYTLTVGANLAASHWSAGRVADAVALQERVVADAERVFGNDHPHTLLVRGNLAAFYRRAGRLPEAIALQEQVLPDTERILGKDHPGTLTVGGNLATMYRFAGRLSEAITLDERVLADRERVLGEDHPNTLASRSGLADSYWSTGRVSEAIALLERLVVDRERILGKDHPETVATRLGLNQWKTARTVRVKPGRNEPCPCGSGTKFKLCCGR